MTAKAFFTLLIILFIFVNISATILAPTGRFVITEDSDNKSNIIQYNAIKGNQTQENITVTGKAIENQESSDKNENFIIKFFKKLLSLFNR
ncbi:hypothetical protein J4225_02885 [Candidatus Pacearchaeota archaeon]|nr:hypothetical protein [uncultured archaeon]MBS3085606.1 hypothetical protein [Candidatus Pacearchaeota archaeon]